MEARTGARAAAPAFDLEQALLACARRDDRALRAIYDALAPQMLGVARRLLSRRALADEVVHDAFVKIWQSASGFDPARGSGRAWVFAIVRHLALNALRVERRTDLVEDVDVFGLVSTEDDPETIVLRLSESGRLRLCLDGLAPPHRNAIILAYARGLTHGELAGRFGVPLGTMKSRMRRTLAALKDCMAKGIAA